MPRQAVTEHLRSLLCFALLATAGSIASDAFARDFSIRYHERIDRLAIDGTSRVSFVAHGRQFDLLLESNTGIVSLPNQAAPGNTRLYRGRLSGHSDSWVRLSESANGLSGAIWDGEELWLIDSGERLADYLMTPDVHANNGTVIFALSELSGALGDVLIDTADISHSESEGLTPVVAAASFGPTPGRILDIGLVATAEFSDLHGDQARDVLLEIFNVVEGIFITQVGVQLQASEILLLETNPGELQESDPQTLLRNFADYKARTAELFPLGLAHLFVGGDLDDLDPPVRTVGMANLGVLCDRRFGVGITQASHATILDALIAAHEIGHNFGAPHDAETGSACAVEPDNFIMAPRINGSTRFSQCSIDQMMPEILSAGCMRDIPPTDLQLSVDTSPPQQVHERDTIDFSVVLSNRSNTHVAGVELIASSAGLSNLSVDLNAIDDGYCDATSQLQCVWPRFPAGASIVLNMSAFADTPGTGTLDISVDSLHELDASDNALHFDIEVLPLADLISLLTPGTAALHPGESVRFESSVFNRGDADTTGVTIYIEVPSALEIIGNELPHCTANSAPETTTFACRVGTLRARQSVSFGFSVRVPPDVDLSLFADDPTAGVSVYATSDDIPLSDTDRTGQATITIGETINDIGVTISGSSLVQIGQESEWEISVENLGPDPAESIHVFDSNSARSLPSDAVRIRTTHGTCSLNGSNTEFDCMIPALGVGERATITLNATPAQTGQFFWIEASSETSAPDADRSNNQTSLLVAANDGDSEPAPDITAAGTENSGDSDSGGGGASGAAALLFLTALAALRRRRFGELCDNR